MELERNGAKSDACFVHCGFDFANVIRTLLNDERVVRGDRAGATVKTATSSSGR